METIYAHLNRAAKAWAAAIVPILVGLVASITDTADIDLEAWAGIIGLATVQWLGVYYKANYEVAENEEV